MMTLNELARLGHAMRQFQKAYFRHRGQFALSQAIAAEKKFDAALEELARPLPAPTLFGEQREGTLPR